MTRYAIMFKKSDKIVDLIDKLKPDNITREQFIEMCIVGYTQNTNISKYFVSLGDLTFSLNNSLIQDLMSESIDLERFFDIAIASHLKRIKKLRGNKNAVHKANSNFETKVIDVYNLTVFNVITGIYKPRNGVISISYIAKKCNTSYHSIKKFFDENNEKYPLQLSKIISDFTEIKK